MDKLCWLDIIIILPILYGVIRGIIRGLIGELNALIAVVCGIIGARMWGADLADWIHKTNDWSNSLCSVLAYITIFIGIAIVLSLLGEALQKLIKAIKLGWINHVFGGFCGGVKWIIVLFVMLFVVNKAELQFHFFPKELKQQSLLYQPMVEGANKLFNQVKS